MKKGDKVKCVEGLPSNGSKSKIAIGTIYIVDYSSGGFIELEGYDGYSFNEDRFIPYPDKVAEEYLKEGDVEEFQVGDRVECISGDKSKFTVGRIYTVRSKYEGGYGDPCIYLEGFKLGSLESNFKLQTNNIKGEDPMNISDNVFEVFDKADMKKVQERFGAQYGNTDRDLLALQRDKKDLLTIIKDEEEEANKD